MNTALVRAIGNPEDGRMRPAGWIAGLVVLLAAGALVSIFSTAWVAGLQWALTLPVLAYTGLELRRVLHPRWCSVKIVDQVLLVTDKRGESCQVELRSAPFLSPIYIGINGRFSDSGRVVGIGIFRGQMPNQSYRRLSVGLRGLTRS